MSRIAFFHGLESPAISDKSEYLHDNFSFAYTPAMDYKQKGLFEEVLAEVKNQKIDLLTGSSMGGWFAYCISTLTGIPTVLFNPALHSRTMLEPTVRLGNKKSKHVIVMGRKDDVIIPEKTIEWINTHGIGDFSINYENNNHRTPINIFRKWINNTVNESSRNYVKTFEEFTNTFDEINENFSELNTESYKELQESIIKYQKTKLPLLYRGFDTKNLVTTPIFRVENNRTDGIMGLKHSVLGNQVLNKVNQKFGGLKFPPVFTQTTDIRTMFGKTHTVFPVGKFTVVQSTEIEDLAWIAASGLVDKNEEAVNTYTDKINANSGNEVILRCASYWLIAGEHNWNSLDEFLKIK